MPVTKGKTYAQLNIGDEACFTKTISETDVYQFSGMTGDFNPVHVDAVYAQATRFGKRIAHGPLTLSLIASVLGMQLPGLGTVALELSCRFKAPVYIGDTVTAGARVSEKLADKEWVRLELTWTNQDQNTVATGSALVMPPS